MNLCRGQEARQLTQVLKGIINKDEWEGDRSQAVEVEEVILGARRFQ